MQRALLKPSWFRMFIVSIAVGGCAIGNVGSNLSMAILNQNDPETVRDGAPAFLLLIDSLIEGDPENPELLSAGAKLYSIYSGVFVEDPERARRLAGRARHYGQRALCSRNNKMCNVEAMTFEEYRAVLRDLQQWDLTALYSFTLSWLVWVKLNSDDWSALANLPKIEAALYHIIQLDETFDQGTPHTYLGIINSRPPALGGKPDEARHHFELAIEFSQGRNLGAKVDFARSYARLVYDRDLHDQLLLEVLEGDAEAPGFTLTNVLAQRDAQRLLDTANDYF